MEMARVAFITNSLGYGGAEKILAFVANCLSERGHNCAIINLNVSPSDINVHMQPINRDVQVYTVGNVPEKYNKNTFRIKEIKRTSQEFGADVLIGFTVFPNIYAKIVGTMLRIPSIMSERGDPERTKGNNLLKEEVSKFIINRSSGGVFQTPEAMEFYGRGLRKRSVVIPNPIFTNGKMPETKERAKTVVSVGRLDNVQKRYDVMLKAFTLFSQKFPEYILRLYGSGPDEGKIKSWVKEYGITEKVKFMGVSRNPMQDTYEDGIFIITSDYEGISNALLEAMAVGLPCVSTDHTPGGARLLIQDHENGLLAPTGDAEKLAAALCEFADNPRLAEKCGNHARRVIDRFDADRIVDMWENYIIHIAGK